MTPVARRAFGANGFGAVAGPLSLGKPAAAYPGRVATDADLMIAVDRQQTRLAVPLDSSATLMTVENAAAIRADNLLTIDSEIVKTTGAPVGNVVAIARGFDGTAPATHLASAVVSGFVDAYHHNALAAEVEAIEQSLGANLSRIPASPQVFSTHYDFPPQTPGGTLLPGAQSITLSPVPAGVNGTDTNHSLWISGGTGTAEAVPIVGGTAVSGAASGTVIVTCANSHSGAWTISSASAGISEAISDNPGDEIHIPAGVYIMHDTLKLDPAKSVILSGEGNSTTGTFLFFGNLTDRPAISIIDPASNTEMKTFRNFNMQGTGNATGGNGFVLQGAARVTIDRCAINNFAGSGIFTVDSIEITVRNCSIAGCGQWGVFFTGFSNMNCIQNSYCHGNSRSNGFGGIGITGPSASAQSQSLVIDGVAVEANGTLPFTTVTTAFGIFVQNVVGIAITSCYIENNVGVDEIIYSGAVSSITEYNNWINGGRVTYAGTTDRITSWGNIFYGADTFRSLPASVANCVIGPDTCLNGSPECGNHARVLGLPGSTGVGAALLGANSPATVLTAPYTWLKTLAPDGTVVFLPVWK